jgi:hypothetical protein
MTASRIAHEAFAAEARLLLCQLEIEEWLALRASQQAARRQPAASAWRARPVPETPGVLHVRG